MNGHQADTVAALFEDRRLGTFRFRGRSQFVDESPERESARGLVLPCQLGDVKDVGQRLLARRAEDESDVCACGLEKPGDRVGYRPQIATAMQRL